MTSCTNLPVGTPVQDIIWCALEMAAGSRLLIALILFAIFIYGMYKLRIPFIPTIILGSLLLYVYSISDIAPIFTNLQWILVMLLGAIIFLAFWRLRR